MRHLHAAILAILALAHLGAAPAQAAPCVTEAQLVAAVAGINAIRLQAHLPELAIVPELGIAAQQQAETQAARARMGHDGVTSSSTPGLRITALYPGREYAEIVAAGYTIAAGVVPAWMASPAHRQVILSPAVEDAGIGTACDSSGRAYWAVEFGRR